MKKTFLTVFLLGFTITLSMTAAGADKNPKVPVVEEAPDGSGRMLILPADVKAALLEEFPTYRIPKDADYDPDMLRYYNSRLIGVHPAVAWGDFNGDKKRDYAFVIITGDTKWGALCELLIMDGKSGGYDAIRLGEIYNFKDDYISFVDNKLYKGRYKKDGWYINWDPKKKAYQVLKS